MQFLKVLDTARHLVVNFCAKLSIISPSLHKTIAWGIIMCYIKEMTRDIGMWEMLWFHTCTSFKMFLYFFETWDEWQHRNNFHFKCIFSSLSLFFKKYILLQCRCLTCVGKNKCYWWFSMSHTRSLNIVIDLFAQIWWNK